MQRDDYSSNLPIIRKSRMLVSTDHPIDIHYPPTPPQYTQKIVPIRRGHDHSEPGISVSFLVSRGGVRLSPFGTSVTNWPIVPVPDDI
jgi:hypothetical protein